MHRHVVAHRDHVAIAGEDRARIIATLFNVRRKRAPSQRRAHLLRNGVKDVFKNFDLYRITHHARSNANQFTYPERAHAFAKIVWNSLDTAAYWTQYIVGEILHIQLMAVYGGSWASATKSDLEDSPN